MDKETSNTPKQSEQVVETDTKMKTIDELQQPKVTARVVQEQIEDPNKDSHHRLNKAEKADESTVTDINNEQIKVQASQQTTAQSNQNKEEREKTSQSAIIAETLESEESIENRGAITKSRIKAPPREVEERFNVKTSKNTSRYYHKENDKEAFRDKGNKIIVKPESTKMVATDIVKIADSKGWTNIKVTGNETFRREVWKEANLRGIEVTGYKATEQDKRDLDSRLNSIEAAPRDNQSEKENKKIAPKVAVGAIGDVKSQNPEANILVDKRKALEHAYNAKPKEEALKSHPELKELYRLESAANQFAQHSIEHPKSQEQFVTTVRDRGLDELAKGNQLPELRAKPIQPQVDRGQGIGR